MELADKRVAILVEQMYEDLELWYPCYRLREAGAEVVLVGPKAGESYPSKHGYPAKATRSAADVSAEDFDALVIPGGYSPDHMRRSKAMVRLVTEMVQRGKPVAAICHGPWMLCSADVIRNRRVTSFPSIKDDLIHAGAEWIDQEVVEDGNLITSRQPSNLPAFMRTLVKSLAGVQVGAS